MFRIAPVVDHDAIPNGTDCSTSMRMEILRSVVTTSINFSPSIQTWMVAGLTTNWILYQRLFSNVMNFVVSLLEASSPSRLDNPTRLPPHPPTIRLQGS